jgi:pimeloyl-ACP methyl ester carboxylesterase
LVALAILAALILALSVLAGVSVLLERRAEVAFPPIGRMLQVEGLQLHVVEKGHGQPVIFIHGAFGALQDFTATVFEPVSRGFRAIAIDRPGHGYSQAPADGHYPNVQARLIREAARALGAERPILVGFSLGGALALTYALEYPDDVGALVLINPPTEEWPGRIDFLFRWPGWPVVGPMLAKTLALPIGLWRLKAAAAEAFSPEPTPPNFIQSPTPLGLRPRTFLMSAAERRVLKPSLRAQMPRYRRLPMPITILAGAADVLVRASRHALGLHRAVPHSELIMLPGLGHNLLYGHTDLVISAIEQAARRMIPASGGEAGKTLD